MAAYELWLHVDTLFDPSVHLTLSLSSNWVSGQAVLIRLFNGDALCAAGCCKVCISSFCADYAMICPS
jgi:hypothetical protein